MNRHSRTRSRIHIHIHGRMISAAAVLIAAALCDAVCLAGGTQHLISPGGDLSPVLEKVEAGDEILLLPGRHQPIRMRNIAGDEENPIIVRALDPTQPVVITEAQVGIHLINCAHIRFSDIIIQNPSSAGIIIEASRKADMAAPATGMIRLTRIDVVGVGVGVDNDSERPALRIDAVRGVEVAECNFTGWCGVGCDIVAAKDVSIRQCTFVDGDRTTETMAARIRAGSDAVQIRGCTFDRSGIEAAILVGGATQREQFIPVLTDPVDDTRSRYEARGVDISGCTFLDQPCPIIFAHADRIVVRNNTMVRPQRYVMAALQASNDPAIASNRHITFGQNLITWKAGRLSGLLLLDQTNRDVSLAFEENLWWSDDPVAVRSRMIPGIARQQFPQVLDIDPKLDDTLRPQIASASQFGREHN